MLPNLYSVVKGLITVSGQSLAAAQQQQRRFLGQHRDHPYHPHVASSSAVGKRDAGD